MKKGITVVILTKNEERYIKRCLKSLTWVDEILVVDDFSNDKTVELVRKMGVKVKENRLESFCQQRNWALDRVETEWVLFIDADEEMTPGLAKEMKAATQSNEFAAYRFPRKNIIFGKWMRHAGWFPDYQTHLFKVHEGRYVREVHEQVEIKRKVGELKEALIHHNYDSITQYLSKMMRYTDLEAAVRIKEEEKFVWQKVLRRPLEEFLRRFFAEEGFKDGVHGLALSLLQAFSELIVVLKIWEKERFFQDEARGVLPEIDIGLKETEHWLSIKMRSMFDRWRLKLRRRI